MTKTYSWFFPSVSVEDLFHWKSGFVRKFTVKPLNSHYIYNMEIISSAEEEITPQLNFYIYFKKIYTKKIY